MLSPLQAHIKFLENTIQSLKNRLARPGLSIEEVEDIELQLSLSESALEHYHQAYALELKISGGEPPDQSRVDGVGRSRVVLRVGGCVQVGTGERHIPSV